MDSRENRPIYELEQMIDKHGLTAVVDLICQVCYEKAEHIRANYQDENLAHQWESAAHSLVNPKTENEKFPS